MFCSVIEEYYQVMVSIIGPDWEWSPMFHNHLPLPWIRYIHHAIVSDSLMKPCLPRVSLAR